MGNDQNISWLEYLQAMKRKRYKMNFVTQFSWLGNLQLIQFRASTLIEQREDITDYCNFEHALMGMYLMINQFVHYGLYCWNRVQIDLLSRTKLVLISWILTLR